MIGVTFVYQSRASDKLLLARGHCNREDSEIVVHQGLHLPPEIVEGEYVLTHRRSGRRLPDFIFDTLAEALAFAAILDGLPEFRAIRVDRIEDGPQIADADRQALKAKIAAAYADFSARRSPSTETAA